ncbi:netrin receptor DCC-like isoform X3 [Eriocheir sinensis]|uniref:netrin receptor DCC-like isoform X3 n=1 Tax=Eriocheir sinensis TaxID=95602 RepID=UPI0021C7AF7F|nr:netrin receptor DCC-like isoform X3 [Eriocheir sinensis]
MLYTQVGSAEEHEVEVTGTSHDLQGLDQVTEHSVWLTAVNSNGGGDAIPEVTARTFSDVPSKEPQNVSVEAASSRPHHPLGASAGRAPEWDHHQLQDPLQGAWQVRFLQDQCHRWKQTTLCPHRPQDSPPKVCRTLYFSSL